MSQPSPPAAEQEAADAPAAECLVHQLCTRCQSKLEVVEYDTEVKQVWDGALLCRDGQLYQAKAEAAVRDLEDRIAEATTATAAEEEDSRSTSLREALEKVRFR